MTNAKKDTEAKFITVQSASLLTGLDKQTIRKLFDNAQIDGYKTPSGQRRLDKQCLQKMCYTDIHGQALPVSTKTNFLYARVSTKKQMDDLLRQVKFLQRPEYSDYVLVQDVASGINWKRKGLSTILDACIQRTVGEVVIAHRDRLSRFATELVETLITKAGGKLTVLHNPEDTSPQDELTDDLLSIIHIYNCRQMGKRSYKKRDPKETVQDSANSDLSNTNTTSAS